MVKYEQTNVACDLCGSTRISEYLSKDGYDVAKCGECGLIFVDPIPDSEFLAAEVYNEGYFNAEKGYGIESISGKSREEAYKRAARIFGEIEKLRKPGRVLDVGCAAGFFLDAARKRG
ncbi:MAG TPA: hypothetical protein PLQ76_01070, partial [bacterium]|nr:hypothetical protein [bacterium]